METLIKQIASQTGITNEQAQTAISRVIARIKNLLSGPVAAQVDGALTEIDRRTRNTPSPQLVSHLAGTLLRK